MRKRKKKRLLGVVTIMLLLSAMLFGGFSWFIGKQIVAGSTQLVTNEASKNIHHDLWKKNGFNAQAFSQTYAIEKLTLKSSFDGHAIPADFIRSDKGDKGVVIMVHGLGGNRKTNYAIAELFLQNGYHVITYDQRSSGENTAEKTTFGVWEKYDLMDCINSAKTLAPGKKVGVWGESFGGATAIHGVAHEQVQDDVAFLILDCPISSMEWMISEEMKKMAISIPHDYMMWCGNLMNKITLGFSYREADAAESAKKIHIPTLVINSKKDAVTPYFMGKDIYERLASTKKTLWTVADSPHIGMWYDHNDEYRSRVLDLMENAQ